MAISFVNFLMLVSVAGEVKNGIDASVLGPSVYLELI